MFEVNKKNNVYRINFINHKFYKIFRNPLTFIIMDLKIKNNNIVKNIKLGKF